MSLFKYLSFIIISSLTITFLCSKLVNIGLRKSSVDFFGKMNAAGNRSLKVNILLTGSSRVLVQVDPKIIDSATGLSSYNYGLNLIGIKTCYNLINYTLTAHPEAKIVLLNIDYNMFDLSKDPYKDPFFYAYENKSTEKFVLTDPKLNFFHNLHIFDISMYDDMARYAAISGFISPNKSITGVYRGYYPDITDTGFQLPPASFMTKKITAPFDDEGLNILKKIITLCRQKQKKIILVIAPYPAKFAPKDNVKNYALIIDKVKTIADSNRVPLLNYSDNFISNNTGYFYDVLHLNVKGAGVYSRLVADDIRKNMDTVK